SIGCVIIVVALVWFFISWSNRRADEARLALGRAITIASTPVSAMTAVGSSAPSFATEQERAQKAIDEFQKVAARYGDPYRTEARLFIARNLLITDRDKGMAELQSLSAGSSETAVLAKFALAQAKEGDGKLDEAAALYAEIAK